MSIFLPFNESSRRLITEAACVLEPHLGEVSRDWRQAVAEECALSEEQMAALERLTLVAASSYLCRGDLAGFEANLRCCASWLARLQADTQVVGRGVELFQAACRPCLERHSSARSRELLAALDILSAATFVALSAAYFDAKSAEAATLLEVLDAELSAVDLQGLLQRVLEITTRTFAAQHGMVLLKDAETGRLLPRCVAGGFSPVGEAALPAEVAALADAVSAGGPPKLLRLEERPAGTGQEARTAWAAALSAGDTSGVLLIGFANPRPWLPAERELLRAIAERSALAIDRAGMTQALREREARIAELSGHLMRVQEMERKRISRELHDETGQALMVIRLYLGMLENSVSERAARAKIRETLAVVDRSIEGIRRIIARLSPLVLQELGLIAAIRKEAKDLAKSTGIRARVTITEQVGRLAAETETAIYRVVQEALHNVAKHAAARSVNIQIGGQDGNVDLVVEDDGVGMPEVGPPPSPSFGLSGIRERISMVGGTTRVLSSRGKGTRIEITVPAVQPAAAPAAGQDVTRGFEPATETERWQSRQVAS